MSAIAEQRVVPDSFRKTAPAVDPLIVHKVLRDVQIMLSDPTPEGLAEVQSMTLAQIAQRAQAGMRICEERSHRSITRSLAKSALGSQESIPALPPELLEFAYGKWAWARELASCIRRGHVASNGPSLWMQVHMPELVSRGLLTQHRTQNDDGTYYLTTPITWPWVLAAADAPNP